MPSPDLAERPVHRRLVQPWLSSLTPSTSAVSTATPAFFGSPTKNFTWCLADLDGFEVILRSFAVDLPNWATRAQTACRVANQEDEERAPDETSALAFPLRTQEAARRGPLLAGNGSKPPDCGQWTSPRTVYVGSYPPAVENPVENMWRTGPVLWITVCPPQWRL